MLEMFAMSFMQRALLAGLIVAVICPAVGLFLVLRRLAQFGDTLAHVSLAGVAAGLVTKTYPVTVGLLFSVGASLGIDSLRRSYRRYSELSVAIVLSAALGLAVVLLTMAGGAGANVESYLFGSIFTVTSTDLYLIGALGVIVMLALLFLYKEMVSVTFDEEAAHISGLPVRFVNTTYTVLTAMTVSMAMQVVGVMLISSLMVVPVATALQLAHSFRGALVMSIVVGLVSVVGGLMIAYPFNLAPAGTMVLTAVGILLLVLGYKRILGLE